MMRTPLAIAVAAFGALILIANTFFIVPLTAQAIVFQFGQAQRVINKPGANQPGLYVKVPFLQDVHYFDRRNLGFTLPNSEIVGADQERLVVDAFARYRIVDPLRFYQQVGTEQQGEQRLRTNLENELRETLGGSDTREIVSSRRSALMRQIAEQMAVEARSFGVEIIDVRIRQADFVDEVQERVFERMKSERQRVATEIRAKGNADATVIIAEATERAQKTKGEGDAERTRLYRESFGRDPEFAAFYRSMQAYEKVLPKGTKMVVAPDGEFFRFLKDKDG